MFDFETLNLQNDLAKNRQSAMLEAERLKVEDRNRNMTALLEGLSSQYSNIGDSKLEGLFGRKRLIESATIQGVRDVMFNIFEASLLLDDNVKEYYAETIQNVFNAKFNEVIKENSIVSLKNFQSHISNGHRLLQVVTESSHSFVQNTADIYTSLLESHYNDSSIGKIIVETYEVLTEASKTPEQKGASIANLAKAIITKLHNVDIGKPVGAGDDIKRLIILAVKAGAIENVALRPVSAYVSIMEDAIKKASQKKNLSKYGKEMSGIKSELLVAGKGLKPETREYQTIQKLVDRIDTVRKQIDGTVAGDKSLQESSLIELVLEAQQATIEGKEGKTNVAISKIKEGLTAFISVFTPYKGLEHLKVVNEVMKDNSNVMTYALIPLIGPFIYIVTKLIRSKNITAAMANDAISEADKFLNNLEQKIRQLHKAGDKKTAKKLERQYARLELFTSQYKDTTRNNRVKSFRESDIPLQDLVESAMEMAQYLVLYEATSEEMSFMLNKVLENADSDSSTDKQLLMDTVHCETCGGTVANGATLHDCAMVESAMYGQINNMSPGELPHSAHKRLQEGQYPEEADFLDDEERSLIDSIAKMNGKDKAIEIIKDRVVSIIENEETRTKKREEDEQAILNKMTPDDVNSLKSTIQETAAKVRVGSGRLNIPESLFESIIMNRSKNYIQESVSTGKALDITANKDTILYESIVLYTIHETFNTLGFESFTPEHLSKTMNQYYYEK